MNFFDIHYTLFTAIGYEMSYLEFFGTIAGAIAVWLSAKANVWSWPVGIINVILFCFLFYQVQLYPDMFLQIFYFITNILGWWRWTHPDKDEEDHKLELRVSYMDRSKLLLMMSISVVGTFALGYFAGNLHRIMPLLFTIPSAFPYADSFVTVLSIMATFLMIQKKVESWIFWIVIDAVATWLYFLKGIKFVGLEYLIFCFLAAYGLWNWMQEYKSYKRP